MWRNLLWWQIRSERFFALKGFYVILDKLAIFFRFPQLIRSWGRPASILDLECTLSYKMVFWNQGCIKCGTAAFLFLFPLQAAWLVLRLLDKSCLRGRVTWAQSSASTLFSWKNMFCAWQLLCTIATIISHFRSHLRIVSKNAKKISLKKCTI